MAIVERMISRARLNSALLQIRPAEIYLYNWTGIDESRLENVTMKKGLAESVLEFASDGGYGVEK